MYSENNKIYGNGYNGYGELGPDIGTKIYNMEPVSFSELNLSNGANDKIRMISAGVNTSIFCMESGKIHMFGRISNDTDITYKLYENLPPMSAVNNSTCKIIWSPSIHKYCSEPFRENILIFYKCLKRIQKSVKLPKFVIYEIIKFIDR